jgi:hypothetical protein
MTADMGKFLACVGLLCLLFPPLLGLVLGAAFFLGLWWLFFKLIGGWSPAADPAAPGNDRGPPKSPAPRDYAI